MERNAVVRWIVSSAAVLALAGWTWEIMRLEAQLKTVASSVAQLSAGVEADRARQDAVGAGVLETSRLVAEMKRDLTAVLALLEQTRVRLAETEALTTAAHEGLAGTADAAGRLAASVAAQGAAVDSLEQRIAGLEDTVRRLQEMLASSPSATRFAALEAATAIAAPLPPAGAADAPPAAASPPEVQDWVPYPVRPGDTLWHISLYFTGTPSRYREIAAANDVAEGFLIRAGQWLRIPTSLIDPAAWHELGFGPVE